MAYGGKSSANSIGNSPSTSTVKLRSNTSKINTIDSNSANYNYNGISANNSKSSPCKNIKSNKRFNSGTPCISKAFTPLGKPSAISIVKNPSKCKDSTSERLVNNDKVFPSKEARSNKEFNSGAPCTSKVFRSSGKSSVVNTVKKTAKCKGFGSGIVANTSKSSPSTGIRSNKEFNSVTPDISEACTSFGNLSAINSTKNIVQPTTKNAMKCKGFGSGIVANISKSSSTGIRSRKELNSMTPRTSLGNLSTINSTKNIVQSTTKNAMKCKGYGSGIIANTSKSSSTGIRSRKELNSMTPNTSLGNLSTINSTKNIVQPTTKNAMKCKVFGSGIIANSSKFSPSTDTVSNKEFNSITPGTSEVCTSLDNLSKISTTGNIVQPTTKCKDFNSETVTNSSHSADTISNKELNLNSVIPSISEASISLDNLSPINTMKNIMQPNIFNPVQVTKNSKPPVIKDSSHNAVQKHLIKCNSLEISSTEIIIENSEKSKDFVSENTVNQSVTPHSKNTKSNENFSSGTSNDYKEIEHTPLRKSSVINIVKNTEKMYDFVPGKTDNVIKPPLKHYTPHSVQQRLMRYYTYLETKSDIKTEKNSVKSKDSMPEKPVYDSRPTFVIDTVSDTVHQSSTNKFYAGFEINDKKVKEPVCNQSYSRYNENHRSSTVDLLRCILCIDKERDTVFQPCGHLVVCSKCAKDVDSICPMCRKRIKKKIKAYIN